MSKLNFGGVLLVSGDGYSVGLGEGLWVGSGEDLAGLGEGPAGRGEGPAGRGEGPAGLGEGVTCPGEGLGDTGLDNSPTSAKLGEVKSTGTEKLSRRKLL